MNFETDLGAPADLFTFNVPIRLQDEQGKRKCPNGYLLLDKIFSFSKERTQRNSKPQEMVSVWSLSVRLLIERHTDRSQSIN